MRSIAVWIAGAFRSMVGVLAVVERRQQARLGAGDVHLRGRLAVDEELSPEVFRQIRDRVINATGSFADGEADTAIDDIFRVVHRAGSGVLGLERVCGEQGRGERRERGSLERLEDPFMRPPGHRRVGCPFHRVCVPGVELRTVERGRDDAEAIFRSEPEGLASVAGAVGTGAPAFDLDGVQRKQQRQHRSVASRCVDFPREPGP